MYSQGRSKLSIAAQTGVSRNTAKRYMAGYFGEVDHLIPWQIDHLINWRPKAKNAVEAGSKLVNKKWFYW